MALKNNLLNYRKKSVIYGTGLIALDIVISANPDTPIRQWAGGTCGNVLTVLSMLGWDSYPIARMDSGTASMIVRNDLRKWKVKLDFATLSPAATIPVITQENSRDSAGLPRHKFHWRNCPKCGAWLPNYRPVTLDSIQIIKTEVKEANVFFFDRVSPAALELAEHFRNIGAIVYFEPSAKSDPAQMRNALEIAHIVKYSEQRFSSGVLKFPKKSHPHVEIQTLGGRGLRYRMNGEKKWTKMSSLQAAPIIDTCGSGDWTSAGIISSLSTLNGRDFHKISRARIHKALKFGQALGAWNCGFEGARGGMYEVSQKLFLTEVLQALQKGKNPTHVMPRKDKKGNVSDGFCPACDTVAK